MKRITSNIAEKNLALNVLRDFRLPVSRKQFLLEFASWPVRSYPEAITLLQTLSTSIKLASLANTNELHWERISNKMKLPSYFHHNFPSHELGHVKPDREVFQYVIDSLGSSPENILFFDDNQINVDGALSAGLRAYRTQGISEVIEQLKALGILPPEYKL